MKKKPNVFKAGTKMEKLKDQMVKCLYGSILSLISGILFYSYDRSLFCVISTGVGVLFMFGYYRFLRKYLKAAKEFENSFWD